MSEQTQEGLNKDAVDACRSADPTVYVFAWVNRARLTVEGVGVYASPGMARNIDETPLLLGVFSGATYSVATETARSWCYRQWGARLAGLWRTP